MIGIMGAMPEELLRVIDAMTHEDHQRPEGHRVGGRVYYEGHLFGQRVVAVHSRIGKVAAASTATVLMHHFGVSQLIFTGLAGAMQGDLQLGDVVIATELVQHDMDASPLFKRFEIPLTSQSRFHTDASLSAALEQAAQRFMSERAQRLAPAILNTLPPTGRVVRGLIGSGDLFVHRPEQRARLIAALPELLAVEMEGAAVAQVAHDFSTPFAVIRAISDKANGSAPAVFSRSLGAFAGATSLGVLRQWLQPAH